jgi:hypothetical protein
MRYVVRSLVGRVERSIGWVAVASLGLLGVVSCSAATTQGPVESTTSMVELSVLKTSVPEPSATPTPTLSAPEGSLGGTDSAEQRCMRFAPSDHQLFLKAETVTVDDVRSIVMVTVSPTPTSLLLPELGASDEALMCWSSSADRTSVAQFWVTTDDQWRVLCTAKYPKAVTPEQIGGQLCA